MVDRYLFSRKAVRAFTKNVKDVGPNFCWYWHGVRGVDGFGIFEFNDTVLYAHVFAWMLDRRSLVPPGALVAHSCQYPPCCSPYHLDLAQIEYQPLRLITYKPTVLNQPTDTSPSRLYIAK